ncbi:carbohydrate-binding module family 50 protein [Aspergillus carbonarius ITEM 5010]|uniref:Carbohydrate-binding module family 50 protein n=1 Tax=Aspergillus carbonarius (strain ITEM 5010) TaxID=602072 RepID=A0A1R3R9H0_ASPC5|nr:carbohydrate-binding module family 50 protein [Aspergillus carbonarius ITEM 5010]
MVAAQTPAIDVPSTTADPTPHGPTMKGIAADCNRYYTVHQGDTCYAVEKTFRLTPKQFQQWNPAVSLDCTVNFWPGYAYCVGVGSVVPTSTSTSTSTVDPAPHGPTMTGIPANCNRWYTVHQGDTCYSVAKAFGLTPQQFQQWNPAVSLDCTVNFWPGYAYCVGVGPVVSTTTTFTTVPPSTTTALLTSSTITTSSSTTATGSTTYSVRNPITSQNVTSTTIDTQWPPTKTQADQPTSCDKWHLVSAGDTCDRIYRRYQNTITKQELLEWNPQLKADCDYPFTGYWVCVGIKRPALTLFYPTGTDPVSIPDPTPWTPHPTPTDNSMTIYPPTHTQPGLAPSCSVFYEAKTSDSCTQILAGNPLLQPALLYDWNPALHPDCSGLRPGYFYCIAAYNSSTLPFPPTVTNQPYPTKPYTAKNCTGWYLKEDGDTCSLILAMFGTFDQVQFVAWNPDVGKECIALENGYYYCISDADTPTTRIKPIHTTSIHTAFPSQPAVNKACNRWWLVSISSTCFHIAHGSGIAIEDLLTWNPDISGKGTCDEGLVPDTEICVGVAINSTSTGAAFTDILALASESASAPETATPGTSSLRVSPLDSSSHHLW